MIGGDFVINGEIEIMDLTNLSRDNDGFQITIGGKGDGTLRQEMKDISIMETKTVKQH